MEPIFVSSLDKNQLCKYITSQLNFFFPDENIVYNDIMIKYIDLATERVLNCFKNIRKKYFNDGKTIQFNHLQSDQYCMYLYMLSNFIYKYDNNEILATKLYYLNKALHSVDIYFTTELSEVFLFIHPLGSILGRAKFSNNFIMYQGCTVGCLNDGLFPVFKGAAIMYSNSSILGNSIIGDNVCIASGVSIINITIPDDTIVLGKYPNYIFKKNETSIFERPPFKYN